MKNPLTRLPGGYTLAGVIPKLIFILSTIIASRVDVREYRIPDAYIVIPSVITFTLAALGGFMDIAIRVAQGALVLVFFLLFRRMVKERFGLGDVKLIGASTLAFGFSGVCIEVIAASIAGVVWGLLPRHRGARIPFAPFLAIGMIISAIITEYFGVVPWSAT